MINAYDDLGRLLSKFLRGNAMNRWAYVYNNSFEFNNGANATNKYTYDANGNLTKDSNKGITGIQYNVLNLVHQFME